MDPKKAEFLAKLRETFRAEASEHLEAITSGLLTMERVSDAERVATVERIFREAHSLKGAARAVSLTEAEALCVELESIFAAVKRGELHLSTEMLDSLHTALGVLATLCDHPDAPPSPESLRRQHEALAALAAVARFGRAPDSRAETPAVAPRPPVATEAVASPAVRISTQKRGAILLEAEELVGAKLAAGERSGELRALAADLASRNQRRTRETARRHRDQGSAAAAELLESELLYARELERTLWTLAGKAREDARSLAAITDRLLDDTRNVLLLPCSYLLGTLPAIVRELAREQAKEAELRVDGEDIEIDRRVLDGLKTPLLHLLRNCVDHGIEKPDTRRAQGKPARARVTITARTVEGNCVELVVADDGAGIDVGKVTQAAIRLGTITADDAARLAEADVVQLIFHSGVTTSPMLTDLSGRGLGMAIVREEVEKLGGTIEVTSTRGAGTTFRLRVPLALAAFRGVFVQVAGQRFVIPTAGVVRVGRVEPNELRTIENRQTLTLDDRAVSVVHLRDVLELTGPAAHASGTAYPMIVLRAADRQMVFLVDEVLGEQEVVVKSLGRQLLRVRNIAGATISGSGTVIPILDVTDLLESAVTTSAPTVAEQAPDTAPEQRKRLLIAEDSITARTLVKSILEGAGYEVVATVDGLDALTRLRSEPFDLVVSDVDMPRLNGFELTAKIRADKKLGDLPVVLVTALGSQKDREYGMEVGASAYIVKSDFDQSNLIEIVRRLL